MTTMPRLLRCFTVAALLINVPLALAATDAEIKAFKEAFAAYNNAVAKQKDADVLTYAEKTVTLGKSVYGPGSKSFIALNHNLARAHLRLKQYKEALAILNAIGEDYRKAYGEVAPELIDYYLDLSDAQRGSDYVSNWTRSQNEALYQARKALGEESADYALMQIDIGHIQVVNQHPDGESLIEDGFKQLKKVAPNHPRWGYANFVVGKIRMAHERYADAIEHLTVSLDGSKANAKNSLDTSLQLSALGFLAVALEKTNQGEAATKRLEELGRLKESLGDKRAEPVYVVKPDFPLITTTGRVKTSEGSVMVSYDVDEHGYTTNQHVDFSVGPPAYADAAVAAVKKFRYAPLFQGGKAVAMHGVKYDFKFLIDD
ncbi:MAG TPA: TonB family protein [Candidatus Acidoferrum sp.]|nr:TonB family protein [Candidatus Acidoferrum sp.]